MIRREIPMHRLLILFLLLGANAGCAVAQAHRDQDQMRAALLDLYTNQVIDNLIRAYNRMPIIQLDYTQAQGMITVQRTANLTDSFTTTSPVVNVLTSALGLQNTNQITINAVPVTTSNEVYDAYLEFLSIQDSLIASAEPPPAGAAHICRKCGDLYYWVPIWCRDKFFELALLSTAQRGKSLVAPDQFYTVNVKGFIGEPVPLGIDDDTSVLATLQFDKKIPNDVGYLSFIEEVKSTGSTAGSETSDGSKSPAAAAKTAAPAQYTFGIYDKNAADPAKPQIPPLALTDRIEISLEKDQVAELKKLLQTGPRPARVRLQHNQPSLPTTEDLLQRANFQLQQFNQNIVRQGSSLK
jgi:hypothetical protein